MRYAIRLLVAAILSALAGLVTLVGACPAAAGQPSASDGAASAGWQPGDRCDHVGATRTRQGQTYECVQKRWDDCPRWHHRKPADYTPPADWTRPPQRPCPGACTPTPAASSPTPTTAPPTTPAASTPPPASVPPPVAPTPVSASETLPVTGPGPAAATATGALLLTLGALARFAGRRRIRER